MTSLRDSLMSLISFVLSLMSWLFPDLALSSKIIATMAGLIISLFILILHLRKNNLVQEKKISELTTKHKALASQFSEKQQIIIEYDRASYAIRAILDIAISNTKDAKLSNVANAINIELSHAQNGGENYVKDHQGNKDHQ